jgi:putative hydrolase of the HAD superfamily
VKNEYLRLCREADLGEGREFDLTAVFARMLKKRGITGITPEEFAHHFRDASMIDLVRFPLVLEMLSGLRERGAGVYLLSNAQSCFTLRELDKMELTPLFDGIVISSDVGYKKPSEEIFSIALEKFGITPDCSVYVGNDMRDDIFGAHHSGLRTVYIETRQSRDYDDLTLPVPDYTAKDHEELCRILLSLAEG